MGKITKGEKLILERLDAINGPISSDDLGDLEPKTEREYLMIMWPTQKAILKHLEDVNEFRRNITGRVGFLEAAWKVGGAIILTALVGLAAKMIFG